MSTTDQKRFDEQLAELFAYVDSNPDLAEDELLDQVDQKFPSDVIDAFTAAMGGFTPSKESAKK
jgi:hypothetical protein